MSFWGGLAEGLTTGFGGGLDVQDIRRRNRLDLMREEEVRRKRDLEEQERQLRDQREGIIRGVTHPDQLPDPLFDEQPRLFDGTRLGQFQGPSRQGPADVGGVRLGMQPDEPVPDLNDLRRESFVSEMEGRLANRTPVVTDTPYAYYDPQKQVEGYLQSPEGQVYTAEREGAAASAQSFQRRVRELQWRHPDQATLFALAEDENDLRDILEGHVPQYQPLGRSGSGSRTGDATVNQILDEMQFDDTYANRTEDGFLAGWKYPIDQILAEARRLRDGLPPQLVTDQPGGGGQDGAPTGGIQPVDTSLGWLGRQLKPGDADVRPQDPTERWIQDVERHPSMGESQRQVLIRFLRDPANTLREKQRAMARYGIAGVGGEPARGEVTEGARPLTTARKGSGDTPGGLYRPQSAARKR